jgi:hypothetical protein
MTFPFIFESNFESGDVSEWDSETDTGSQLDVVHYTELARYPWHTAVPYHGAYCLRATLAGGTADAFVTEGDIDIALSTNRFLVFAIWLDPNFTATADDTINILELQSTGPVVEVTFGLRIVAATGVINFGIGETAPTSFGSEAIERGVWHFVELDITLDSGAGDDGTIDLYVTREDDPTATAVHATQVATLDQAAVIQGVLGVQGQLATTLGTILFDHVRFDDTRLNSVSDRFATSQVITKTTHVWVGPGHIDHISLSSGAGNDNVVTLYDTDSARCCRNNYVSKLSNTSNNETVAQDFSAHFTRGCYAILEGTSPQVVVKFSRTPAYGSPGAIKSFARKLQGNV